MRRSLPHVSLRDLAASHGHDGLLLLRLGAAAPTLVVSSAPAASAVLRAQDHVMASRAWSPVASILFYGPADVAFAPYGEPWRQARRLLTTHMLCARKVHSFRHGLLDEVRLVVAGIHHAAAAAETAVDVTEVLGGYTNDVVCRAVLGEAHREKGRNRLFRELSEINVSLLGGFNLEDYFPSLAKLQLLTKIICSKATRVHRRWDQLFDELIHEHRAQAESTESTDQDFIHVPSLLGETGGVHAREVSRRRPCSGC